MSAVGDLADSAEINVQAAQDVQNLLAELKGGEENKAVLKAAPASDQSGGPQSGDGGEDVHQVETNGDTEKKTATTGLEGDGKKEKMESETKKRDVETQNGDHSQGNHAPRDGGRGRGRGRGGRGRGRGDYKSYKQNIKSDLTTQEETDDPVQIRKQVEFYFSDSNLPMDKFLLSQVSGSKNLPVDLKVIHSFKRMRRFQPFSAIPAALKESKCLEVIDDDTKVKRREPLAEKIDPDQIDPDSIKVFEDRAMPRSVYAKGFGAEDKDTQLDIEAFFTQYGPWNAVRLRRANDKLFKGSVFVEFDSEETLANFLAIDPKPKYKGKELQIMSKKDYCENKVEDIKAGRLRPSNREEHRRRGRGGADGGHRSKRKRDDEDDRDWRERRDGDQRNRGFRDSKRGGNNNHKSKHEKGEEIKEDSRGVPVVEATENKEKQGDPTSSSRSKREAATADALAKARAVVEAQNKGNDDNPTTEAAASNGDDDDDVSTAKAHQGQDETVKPGDTSVTDGSGSGKKRGRDEQEEGAVDAGLNPDGPDGGGGGKEDSMPAAKRGKQTSTSTTTAATDME